MKAPASNAPATSSLTPSQALATAYATRLLEDIRSHVLALETSKANNLLILLLANIEARRIVVDCPAANV
jgi:hypothetical protein